MGNCTIRQHILSSDHSRSKAGGPTIRALQGVALFYATPLRADEEGY
ncbi:MAG TPA: hypothetical protein VH540_02800 [Ktedonobacterales bacterium]|jgi:hypothetical protein